METDLMVFCTLFDHNYIDRGLVLYRSLVDVGCKFVLYIIAIDEECESILLEEKKEHLVVISYERFENSRLRDAKSNRSHREFIWTCSCFAIKYVLDNYNVPICTFIDSDLYFYSNPEILLNGFISSGKDVGIIAHNYSKHYENMVFERYCGKYCVEFNTFRNNDNGRRILDWWIDRCVECCTSEFGAESYGDQKYLDEFEERFDGVYVYDAPGAGVAPWNVDAYTLGENMSVVRDGRESELIFYHFHDFSILDSRHFKGNVYTRIPRQDDKLINTLYKDYFIKRINCRGYLKKRYDLYCDSNRGNAGKKNYVKVIKELKNASPTFLFFIITLVKVLLYRKRDIIEVDG